MEILQMQSELYNLKSLFDTPEILEKKKAIAECTGIYPTNKSDNEIRLEYFRLMEDPNNI